MKMMNIKRYEGVKQIELFEFYPLRKKTYNIQLISASDLIRQQKLSPLSLKILEGKSGRIHCEITALKTRMLYRFEIYVFNPIQHE